MVKKSFISGAVILMATGLIVRILGFFYRVYLSNLIGAEGMGLFQLISPVYSLVILTLTSGISIAVSKMVAEETARRNFANPKRITACAMVMVIVGGILVSLFMYAEIDFITGTVLKDSRTYYAMLFLIPCIPVIAAAAALKGYFYGIQEVVPTAFSQIAEQIVRIGLVVAMASYFTSPRLEYACALATLAMAFGEISGLFVLCGAYFLKRRKKPKYVPKSGVMRKRKIVKQLLGISVPISCNRLITSLMNAIEVILIPRRLLSGGMDYQSSMEVYGKLTGMAMPLLYFPSLVTYSIATTLVPAISEAMSLKNSRSVNYRISKSIQITFILGFIFTAIFMVYPNEIGNMLYKKEKIGDIIYILSFTCVFIYLQQTLLGVLNGLGKQGVSLRNSLIGNIIRIGFVYFLVPKYGINSYMWGIAASYACVCILNMHTVVKNTSMIVDIRNWILKPGLVGIAIVFAGRLIYGFLSIFIINGTLVTAIAIVIDMVIALMLMVAVGALDIGDMLRLAGFKKY